MDPRYATMPADLQRLQKKPAALRGNLKKQGEGPLAGWKKRYFAQLEDKLHYFTSLKEMASGSKGSIDLLLVISVRQLDPMKNPNRFEVVTPDRVYRLETYDESDKTVSAWIQGIADWLEYIDYRRKRQKKIENSVLTGDTSPLVSSLPVGFSMSSMQPQQQSPRLHSSGKNAPIPSASKIDVANPLTASQPSITRPGQNALEILLSSSLTSLDHHWSPETSLQPQHQPAVPQQQQENSTTRARALSASPQQQSAVSMDHQSPLSSNPAVLTSDEPTETSKGGRQVSLSSVSTQADLTPTSAPTLTTNQVSSTPASTDPVIRTRSPSLSSPTSENRQQQSNIGWRSSISLESASVSNSRDDRAITISGALFFEPEPEPATQNPRTTWHEPSATQLVASDDTTRIRSNSIAALPENLAASPGPQSRTPCPPAVAQADPAAAPIVKPASLLSKVVDQPVNPLQHAMQAMQQQTGSTLLAASPAALIARQQELQRTRPKTLNEMSEDELRAVYEELLNEVDREEDELADMYKKRDTLEDDIVVQERREEELFKSEKLRFEREILEADSQIAQYIARVGQLDKELREKELECDEENWKLYLVREKQLEQGYLQAALTDEIATFENEIQAREESVKNLQTSMDVARISQRASKKMRVVIRFQVFTLADRISLMLVSSQLRTVGQMQRNLFSGICEKFGPRRRKPNIVSRLSSGECGERSSSWRLLPRQSKTFSRFWIENSLRQQKHILYLPYTYHQLEDFLIAREGVEPEVLDNIDELREMFFNALVVGLKLEGEVTGAWMIRDDVEPAQLLHKAMIKGIDWRSWRGWIKHGLIQSDEAYSYEPLNDLLSRLATHAPAKLNRHAVTQSEPSPCTSSESSSTALPSSGVSVLGSASGAPSKLPETSKKVVRRRNVVQIEDAQEPE